MGRVGRARPSAGRAGVISGRTGRNGAQRESQLNSVASKTVELASLICYDL